MAWRAVSAACRWVALPTCRAGAYSMSMASNYNTRGRAAEVMVSSDQAWLIRDRERPSDLFRGEHLLVTLGNPGIRHLGMRQRREKHHQDYRGPDRHWRESGRPA